MGLHLQGTIVMKWFNTSLILLIFMCSEQAFGEECLYLSSSENSVILTNDSYAELSWKADISNSCSEPASVSVTYRITDINGLELGYGIETDIYVPPYGTGKARDTMLISPPDALDQSYSSLISFNAYSYSPTQAEQCLRVGAVSSNSINTNSFYEEISWKVDVFNDCDESFDTAVYFKIYDAEEFQLDYGIETSVFVPPNGIGKARDTALLAPELIQRKALIGASLTSQYQKEVPDWLEAGQWISSSTSHFDFESGLLTTSVNGGTAGNFNFTLSPISSEGTTSFKINQSSIIAIGSTPPGASAFYTDDSTLRIPVLRIDNNAEYDFLENLVLNLTNQTDLLFALESYAYPMAPNGSRGVEGASTCLVVDDLGFTEIESNSTYTELSWFVDILNSCSESFEIDLYFNLFDDDEFLIDYGIETRISVPPNGSSQPTDTILLSPPNLVDQIFKMGTKIRVR